MEELQRMVSEFHKATGYFDRSSALPPMPPRLGDNCLRASLIAEESAETVVAILAGDLPKAVDGLVDLIYVCVGAALRWGVDLGPVFAAVHKANMAKAGGPVRGDGKIMKPPGWTPPDVDGLLRAQGWSGR